MTEAAVRRGFADLSFGQVHYRCAGAAGNAPPLVMFHSSPGSARQLVPLIAQLAAHRRVIAPDTPGHGDSAPIGTEAPVIRDYAVAALELLDVLGLDRVDLYGSHTGAAIAAELALLAPHRVCRVVLDGISVFAPAFRDELLEHYAQPFVPDLDGAYLMRAFHFLRDQYVFWPWYRRTREALRGTGLRAAPELHAWLVEILKSAETYHIAYRAAFRWEASAVLPSIVRPTLAMSAIDDPLIEGTRSTAPLLPDGRFVELPRYGDPDFAAIRVATITTFLTLGD